MGGTVLHCRQQQNRAPQRPQTRSDFSMPNRLQVGFLASFFVTLSSLIFLAHWLKARLKAAGYDISELILIGLPKDRVKSLEPSPSFFDIMSGVLENFDWTFSNWSYPELVSLGLAFGLTVAIWINYALTKMCKSSPQPCTSSYSILCLPVSPKDCLEPEGVEGVPLGGED